MLFEIVANAKRSTDESSEERESELIYTQILSSSVQVEK